MRLSLPLTALFGALVVLSPSSGSARPDARPQYDAFLEEKPARAADPLAGELRAKAAGRVNSQLPVHLEERLGVPTFLFAAPEVSGDPGSRSKFVLRPEATARGYLARFGDLYRLSAQDVETAELAGYHDLGEGAIIVTFKQRVGGYEVFRDRVKVLMDQEQALVSLSGYLSPHAGRTVVSPASFRLGGSSAVARAFADLTGGSTRPGDFGDGAPGEGGYRYVEQRAAFATGQLTQPARLKQVLFGLKDRLVPSWYVEVNLADRGQGSRYFSYVISAEDGRVLFRNDLTASADYSYRVWADAVAPFTPQDGPPGNAATPHPTGTANGLNPAFVPTSLITLQNAPFSRNDPWLPPPPASPARAVTTGNNVDAYLDIAGADGFDSTDVRPDTVTAGGTDFNYTYDPTVRPGQNLTQREAAGVQLFFTNNWLHDDFYDAGFDEAAGNAQFDNYGRGGLGGDRLRAEGQDSSGTNNANMATPADGASPRMQMYTFTTPIAGITDPDGTIDNGIVAHEWGHYISNRLIGDANGLANNQGRSMGEGWGDFHALLVYARQGDSAVAVNNNWQGVYSITGYAWRGQDADSYYYGLRRYPYSTDLNKSPLTFRHIANGTALPANPAPSFNGDNAEVHNAGEIWAAALWECYTGLLRDTLGATPRLTFTEAQRRMKQYLVAGYKATPNSPTFTEARDAILAAMWAGDAADYNRCYDGFAKRGMGSGAVSPPRNSSDHVGVIESTANGDDLTHLGSTLNDDVVSCDTDTLLDRGEAGRLEITLRNTGKGTLSNVTVAVSSPVAGISFPNGSSISLGTMEPRTNRTAVLRVDLAPTVTGVQILRFDYAITATGVSKTAFFEVRANADDGVPSSRTEGFETLQTNWTVSGVPAGAPEQWRRSRVGPTQHVYFGEDPGQVTDQWLISPPLTAAGTAPSVSLTHRYKFEYTPASFPFTPAAYYDGGVIECSVNGGASWVPFPDAAYPNQTLSTGGQNPIEGRRAYSAASAGYPGFVTQNNIAGPAGCAVNGPVLIRFRVGSDVYVGDVGWELDSVTIGNITNNPFKTVVAEATVCSNLPPTANAGPDQAVDEGAGVALDGSASVDGNGDAPLGYSWVQTSPATPVIALTGAGTATPSFTAPQVTATTVFTFTLTASDPAGLTGTDSVAITVNDLAAPNQPPVANAGIDQSPAERSAVTLDGTGSLDPEGASLGFSWAQTGGTPTVALTGATTSTPSFTAPDVATATPLTFTLTVSDGSLSSADTVVVTVQPLNRAPTAAIAGPSAADERTAGVTLSGAGSSDPDSGPPDNDTLAYAWSYSAAPGAPALTLSGATSAQVSFDAPEVGADTDYTLTLTVRDASNATATASQVVKVRQVNRAPVAQATGPASVSERTAGVQLDASGSTDPDLGAPNGDALSYAWSEPSPGLLSSLVVANPTFTAPEVASDTSLQFTVTVTDQAGLSSSAPVSVLIQQLNRVPTAAISGATEALEGTAAISLSGAGSSDPDAGPPDNDAIASYAWSYTGAPALVNVAGANTASLSFDAPNVAADASYTFTLTVTDGKGATGSSQHVFTVRRSNSAPTARLTGPANAAERSMDVTFDATTSSDPDSGPPDNDTLSYAFTATGPAGAPALTAKPSAAGLFVFDAPQVAADTTYSIQVQVTDGSGAFDTATLAFTVRQVNRAPTAAVTGPATAAERTASVALSGTGSSDPDSGAPDNDALSYAWSYTSPAGAPALTLSGASTSAVSFAAPNVAANTVYTFTLTVTDQTGATASAVHPITVEQVNRAPVAAISSLGSAAERTAGVALNGGGSSDPDGGAPDNDAIVAWQWTYSAPAGAPALSLVDANTAEVSFTAPDVASDTVYTFTLTVTDSSGATGTATRPLSVLQQNRAPTAVVTGPAQADERTAAVTLSGSSSSDPDSGAPDNDTLGYAWTVSPSVALTGADTASVSFTAPEVAADTAYSLTLTVTDRAGATAQASQGVTIKQVNRAPSAAITGPTAVDERTVAVTLDGSSSSDPDAGAPDNDTLAYAWTVSPALTLTGASTASMSFDAPEVTIDTEYTFTLSVTDDAGQTATATHRVTVAQRNRTPVASASGPAAVDERTSSLTVSAAGSSDPDADSLTYAWTVSPALALSGADTATAGFTAPQVASDTVYTFTVTVTDSAGANDTASHPITIRQLNRAPLAVITGATSADERTTGHTLSAAASSDADAGAPDDDAIVAWAWTVTPALTLTGATTPTVGFDAGDVSADVEYAFQLVVTDRAGATSAAAIHLFTVRNLNRAPVADAGADQAVDEGNTVQLTAAGSSDADGDFLTYAWSRLSGPAVTFSNPIDAAPTFVAEQVGSDQLLILAVDVSDGDLTTRDTVTITIRQVNQAPIAEAGNDQTVDERSTVTLDGSASSDGDGDGLSYKWTQTGGAAVVLSSDAVAQPTFAAPDVTAPVTLTFSLVVSDGQASSAADVIQIAVRNVNRRPVANAGPAQTVDAGATVTLSGSGTDEDGDALSYTWTQTGGPAVTLGSASAASTTFAAPSPSAEVTLTFALEARDETLASDPSTVAITVRAVVGGTDPLPEEPTGCGCTTSSGGSQLMLGFLPFLLLFARRRARAKAR